MVNVIVKIHSRYTVAQVVLAKAQLIDGDFLVVPAVEEDCEFGGVCILLEGFFVLHLVAVKFSQFEAGL
jgi:hypothetical protein